MLHNVEVSQPKSNKNTTYKILCRLAFSNIYEIFPFLDKKNWTKINTLWKLNALKKKKEVEFMRKIRKTKSFVKIKQPILTRRKKIQNKENRKVFFCCCSLIFILCFRHWQTEAFDRTPVKGLKNVSCVFYEFEKSVK